MTKQEQIYNELRKDILNGIYQEHELLISESEICKKFGVSREPVRRALRRLIDKGYINSKHGKGYFVNPKGFYFSQSLLSSTQEEKSQMNTKVLTFEQIQNTLYPEMNSETLFHYIRLRCAKENTVLEEGFLPVSLFEDFTKEICEGSIISYIENDKKIHLTHDQKLLRSVLIDESHILNQDKENKIKSTIEINHRVYSNDSLIQCSIQMKYNDEITIVGSK